jgi:hypothetical protein
MKIKSMQQIFFLSLGLTFQALFLSSCSTNNLTYTDPKNIDEYYQSKGITTYVLPDLPDWANFIDGLACFRDVRFKSIDLNRLAKSFNLSYSESVFFQVIYNRNYAEALNNFKVESLSLKEEEIVFFKTLDQVTARFYVDLIPKFENISVIWVDTFLSEKFKPADLNWIFARNDFSQGEPVLVSLCLGYQQLEKMAEILGYPQSKLVSAEMFTNFSQDGIKLPQFQFDFGNWGEKRSITVYAKSSGAEKYLKGKFKVKLIKGD